MSQELSSKFLCPICYRFASLKFKGILRHIGSVHSNDANFNVVCGVTSCPRTFKTFHAYKKHLYRSHRDECGLDLCKSHDSQLDDLTAPLIDENTAELEDCHSGDSTGTEVTKPPQLQSALLIMKLKQKYKLSQVALNAVTDEVTDLVQSKLISLEQKLHNVLGGVLTNEQLSSINDILKQQDLTNPFGGLRNAYQQEAYFTTYLDYQKPVRRELGGETDKQDVVYDIPFLKSLQLLLKHDILRNKVLQGHERADGLLGDFCDGSLFKMHPLFSADKTALQIQLYYDDVEICNPLGSRAKKHKLALFYFTIGNIPPKYRSPLANIHLLCVTKSVTLQKYGAHKVLQPIMNKIKKLEEDGISIKTDDCVHHFYGTISVFQGDNLGSQFIGGYKSLASAHRKCRHCLSVSDDMQSKFLAHEFKERNRSTHEYHIRALKTNSATHEHISKSFGINEDSVLHKSTYFHITEGLVPDIMHDVLEGCLPYVVKEMLKVFISHKFISLSLLEKIISKFPYGITDKANKPSVISSTTLKNKDHNLKQTATEMWCLARLLPIMIGNHIPKDNPYWLHFLALLEIVDYLFAPIISTECLDHMRILIRDHHSAFKELYPECNLIPKMHYMVHYPDWIQRCGPLSHLWCMRLETKHNYFKDLAHRIKCFKNVLKTLSEHYQHSFCYNLSSNNFFNTMNSVGPCQQKHVASLQWRDALCFLIEEECAEITSVSWIIADGHKYKRGQVIIIDCTHLMPNFGIITDIVVCEVDNIYIILQKLETLYYNYHYHSYSVAHTDPVHFTAIKVSQFYDHHPLSLYESQNNSELLIPLKYYIAS